MLTGHATCKTYHFYFLDCRLLSQCRILVTECGGIGWMCALRVKHRSEPCWGHCSLSGCLPSEAACGGSRATQQIQQRACLLNVRSGRSQWQITAADHRQATAYTPAGPAGARVVLPIEVDLCKIWTLRAQPHFPHSATPSTLDHMPCPSCLRKLCLCCSASAGPFAWMPPGSFSTVTFSIPTHADLSPNQSQSM